jgi:hypothetical protein
MSRNPDEKGDRNFCGGGTTGMGTQGQVYRMRPVCAHPKQSKHKGSDNINDAADCNCVDSHFSGFAPGFSEFPDTQRAARL